jgi:hypothetical protein
MEPNINSNYVNAQNDEIEEDVYDRLDLSSSNDTAGDLRATATISAKTIDVEDISEPTSQQGSLTLHIGESEYNHQFRLGDLNECQDKLKEIAPRGSFTTYDFVHDALAVVMPSSFESIMMQLAISLGKIVLQLALGMLSTNFPSPIELSPKEHTFASRVQSRIQDDIPHIS